MKRRKPAYEGGVSTAIRRWRLKEGVEKQRGSESRLTALHRVEGEDVRVADDDETGLRPRYSDVEALGAGEEAEREPLVDLEVVLVRADGVDGEDAVRERKRFKVSAKSSE